ncbi:MAG TPA: hypothetical protein VFI54_21365 [Solirubrobacteraceae bacterium]|nr:hypothetical protein [Solirubrobacteraceae bacterium]
MQGQIEIQRSLQAVAAALNDGGLDKFDTARVQLIVDEAVGGARRLTVDDGGGVHDPSGTRMGAIRRAPSGEWIIDGQNTDAARADAKIPAAAEDQSGASKDNEP